MILNICCNYHHTPFWFFFSSSTSPSAVASGWPRSAHLSIIRNLYTFFSFSPVFCHSVSLPSLFFLFPFNPWSSSFILPPTPIPMTCWILLSSSIRNAWPNNFSSLSSISSVFISSFFSVLLPCFHSYFISSGFSRESSELFHFKFC